MDPLTYSAAIISIISLANAVVKSVQALRQVRDPRFDEMYYRIVGEREKTLTWARQLEASGQLESTSSAPRIRELLSKMQTYYQEADDTLAPLHVPGGTRITTHLLLRRVNFANGGYEELRQKVDAIKAMNGALNAIAPPLPTYYNSVGFIGKTVPTAPLSAIPAVAHEEDEDRLGPVIGDELEVQDGVISTKVEYVFSTVLKSIRCISDTLELGPPVDRLSSRLERWGSGLFDNKSLSLDDLLQANDGRNVELRRFILRALVDIAVAEERILSEAHSLKPEKREQRENRLELLFMIYNNEEVLEIAAEQLGSRPADDYSHSAKEGTDKITGGTIDSKLKCHIDDIDFSITLLVGMLSSIRVIRHSRLLELETQLPQSNAKAQAKRIENPVQEDFIDTKDAKDLNYSTLIQRNINLTRSLREALQNDEEYAKKYHFENALEFSSPELGFYEEGLRKHQARVMSLGKKTTPYEKQAMLSIHKVLVSTTDQLLQSRSAHVDHKSMEKFKDSKDDKAIINGLFNTFKNADKVLGSSGIQSDTHYSLQQGMATEVN